MLPSNTLIMPKQKLTLSIDKDVSAKAKKQEINISAFVEIHLVDYLTRMMQCSRREYTFML